MDRKSPNWINKRIAATAEYAARTIGDEITVCPNCKRGLLWARAEGWFYCEKCGIEGPGLAGIVFIRRATALPIDPAAYHGTAGNGSGMPDPVGE